MKKYMPLNGLRWSRDSGSTLYDTPQTVVLGQPGGHPLIQKNILRWKPLAWLHQSLCRTALQSSQKVYKIVCRKIRRIARAEYLANVFCVSG